MRHCASESTALCPIVIERKVYKVRSSRTLASFARLSHTYQESVRCPCSSSSGCMLQPANRRCCCCCCREEKRQQTNHNRYITTQTTTVGLASRPINRQREVPCSTGAPITRSEEGARVACVRSFLSPSDQVNPFSFRWWSPLL